MLWRRRPNDQNSAIGGAIGTGLFVGSGSILALAGPAPLFMGYLTLMFAVWNIMQILCEMVVYLPYKGNIVEQAETVSDC